MINYEFYTDEQGNSIFPVHPEQTVYLINEENARKKTGQQIGYENVGVLIRMPMKIDYNRFEAAIQRVIDENEMLRAICVKEGNTFKQKIIKHYDFKLQVVQAEGETDEEKEEFLEKFAVETRQIPFDFYKEISHKEMIIRFSENYNVFFIVIQHWLGEDTSLGLIWNQISKYYLIPDAPTVPHVSYLDYIKEADDFLKTSKGIAQTKYWDKELEGYEPFSYECFSYGKEGDGWDKQFFLSSEKLNAISKANKTSNYFIFTLAVHVASFLISGRSDTMTGTISANRTLKYMKTIGYIAKNFPVRMEIHLEARLHDLITIAIKKISKAMLNIKGLDRVGIYQFLITYQNYVSSGRKINEEFPSRYIDVKRQVENPLFLISVTEHDTAIEINTMSNKKQYTEEFANNMFLCVECLFDVLFENHESTVLDVKKRYELMKSKYEIKSVNSFI